MEVYTLDSLLRRDQVIDRFESLIWTERFSSFGDFELIVHSTHQNRSLLVADKLLAINKSWRVMRIETIEDIRDSEGRARLIVKGRSLETILEDRIAKSTMASVTPWVLTGTAGEVARQIFTDICVTGTLSADDVIPFIQPGTIFPTDTIPEDLTSITWTQETDTVYAATKEICDLYDLGFRLVRNFDTSQLYFNIYTGNDRTTAQTILSPVVFSPELDNLQNTTEFKSIANAKNVAYVFSPAGYRIVFGNAVDPEVEGFERRILLVKSELPEGTVGWEALLDQLGKEELSKNRSFQAFDGEFNQNSNYQYGIHYELGDLVEIRNVDGLINNMRVTEQIFVSDKEGERSYPTLSIDLFINPGSWLAWASNQVWEDLDLTTYWADLP